VGAVLPNFANWIVKPAIITACLCSGFIHCGEALANTPNFPTLTGRVVDSAGILDTATTSSVEAKLAAHENETSNQIVVVTVSSLEGYDIADYGIRLARHWGIGTAEKNNGAVLLVAAKDRKVRIEVGYGLEGSLTDSLSGQIIRQQILPAFRKGNYAHGVESGVTAILQAIAGEYKAEARSNKTNAERYAPIAIPFFFVFLVGGQSFAQRKGHKNIARALIPGGFGGLFALLFSKSVFIAIATAVVGFSFIYYLNRNHGDKINSNKQRDQRTNRNDYTSSHHRGSSGGGFSGGGGGFGGGGASGGW